MINLWKTPKTKQNQNKNPACDMSKSHIWHIFYFILQKGKKGTLQIDNLYKYNTLKFFLSKLSVLNKHSSAMTPLTEIPEEIQTHARLMFNGFHFVQVKKKDSGKDALLSHVMV